MPIVRNIYRETSWVSHGLRNPLKFQTLREYDTTESNRDCHS
jgi:hypothetical protein